MNWTRQQDLALVNSFVKARQQEEKGALYFEIGQSTGQSFHSIKHRITKLGLNSGGKIEPVPGLTLHLI